VKLWTDVETRSSIPLKRGITLYSQAVEVTMLQYAADDEPVSIVDMTNMGALENQIGLERYAQLAVEADELWAHVAEFDRTMLNRQPWFAKLGIPLTKWRCTAALARMHGLPGGLGPLSEIFKLSEELAKDKRGKELIQLFCVPNKAGGYPDRHSHPTEWSQFLSYGGQDIVAMREVHRQCPKWNATPRMWAVWHLDQRMNERGVAVDLKLCEEAVKATKLAKQRLAHRTAEITENEVEATTQRNRLLAYMEGYGVTLPDLTADTVERRLEDESLPGHIKELLRIRQQASKASTAKYQRAITQSHAGRLHQLLVFCGANRTGRWAGRTLQPQNLPRPKHKQWEIDLAIEMFKRGDIMDHDPENVTALEHLLRSGFKIDLGKQPSKNSNVLALASSCLRGIIISGPGRKLVVSDYANIEGRDMAWVAGEQWKLDAFAAYDRGDGPDLYKVAYARAFNIDPNDIGDDDWRRQIGKVMELALQYYGGVGAFCSMAETYGLRLEDLASSAWPALPAWAKRLAQKAWTRAVTRYRTYGLEERVWVVCQALVLLWRAAHPSITSFWSGLEQARKMAVLNPGKQYPVGRVVVDRVLNWLRIRLPSGRYLNYPGPRAGDFEHSFMGINPYTKQWARLSTYSGKDAENIVQGIAADHMMDGLLAADAAGYNPLLSVHDEAITEPPDEPQFNDRHLSELMVSASTWAVDLPLAAKGFTSYRYRK
jgi:DNA polymerase